MLAIACINAEGGNASVGDGDWPKHQGEALAILKAISDPSPSLEKSAMGKEWQVFVKRKVAFAEGTVVSKGPEQPSLFQIEGPDGDGCVWLLGRGRDV